MPIFLKRSYLDSLFVSMALPGHLLSPAHALGDLTNRLQTKAHQRAGPLRALSAISGNPPGWPVGRVGQLELAAEVAHSSWHFMDRIKHKCGGSRNKPSGTCTAIGPVGMATVRLAGPTAFWVKAGRIRENSLRDEGGKMDCAIIIARRWHSKFASNERTRGRELRVERKSDCKSALSEPIGQMAPRPAQDNPALLWGPLAGAELALDWPVKSISLRILRIDEGGCRQDTCRGPRGKVLK